MTDKRRSKIWNCFIVTDNTNKIANCKQCNNAISYKSTIHNLKSHLIRKHPRAYNIIYGEDTGTEKLQDPDKEIIEEYLDTSETNAGDSDQISNSSSEDPLKRSKTSYKSVDPKNGEKWFVQFNSNPEMRPQTKKFTSNLKQTGKKKSEVLRQLKIMAQDREKTTNIQMEVCNLQKQKERLIMEQNTKEHELRYSILQLEYECKKEQLELLRKENGKL